MSKLTVNMILEKETKNTYRFQEVSQPKGSDDWMPVNSDDGAVLQTLYLRKDKLNGEKPTGLLVTIETSPGTARFDAKPEAF